MLLSGKFANIKTLEEAQQIINDNWGGGKGFYAENILQFAAGDTGLVGTLINENGDSITEKYSIQSKFSGGYFGWNGTSITSLISAFDFYGDETKVNQIISAGMTNDINIMNQFVQDLGFTNYNLEEWAMNMGYEAIGDTLEAITLDVEV